jgi:hypothetical protein
MHSHAPPVGHNPHWAPSIGAVARDRSVLWWHTQPRAPYIVRAVRSPVIASSRTVRTSGSVHSDNAVTSAGQ